MKFGTWPLDGCAPPLEVVLPFGLASFLSSPRVDLVVAEDLVVIFVFLAE
jgi:hypothetical protein